MMFAALLPFLSQRAARVAGWLVLALVVVAVLLLAYCSGRRDGTQGAALAEQQRQNQVQAQVATADAGAAAARVRDSVKQEQQTEELHNAIQATDDPDRQRALRGCVILRQQGRDTNHIAACGGLAGHP